MGRRHRNRYHQTARRLYLSPASINVICVYAHQHLYRYITVSWHGTMRASAYICATTGGAWVHVVAVRNISKIYQSSALANAPIVGIKLRICLAKYSLENISRNSSRSQLRNSFKTHALNEGNSHHLGQNAVAWVTLRGNENLEKIRHSACKIMPSMKTAVDILRNSIYKWKAYSRHGGALEESGAFDDRRHEAAVEIVSAASGIARPAWLSKESIMSRGQSIYISKR